MRISGEQAPYRPIPRRVVARLAFVTLLLTGCSHSKEAASKPQTVSVTVTPDFSKLTLGGATCEENYPRPCFQPLYKQPVEHRPLMVEDIVNAIEPDGQHVAWPHEAYGDTKGDPLKAVCQVFGQAISDASGNSTNVWDVVEVPAEHTNPQALAEAKNNTHPSFGSVKNDKGEVVAVYAFASDEWLGNHGIYDQLPACSVEQNAGAYQPVK